MGERTSAVTLPDNQGCLQLQLQETNQDFFLCVAASRQQGPRQLRAGQGNDNNSHSIQLCLLLRVDICLRVYCLSLHVMECSFITEDNVSNFAQFVQKLTFHWMLLVFLPHAFDIVVFIKSFNGQELETTKNRVVLNSKSSEKPSHQLINCVGGTFLVENIFN